MPRVKTTRASRAVLIFLPLYLVLLFAVLVMRFVLHR
jgi:hypothetical protein